MLQLSDGARIAFDDVGRGAPVVFLHGFPHDRTLWRPQLEALSESMRCIALDLRGFGQSDVRGPYSMDRWADDVAELLDAIGIQRALLCGVSMGGYVAFAFQRRHARRLRALVLCDTRAGADSAETRARRDALIALARDRGPGAVADEMMPGMVGKSTRARCPGVVASLRAMLAATPLEGMTGALAAMRDRPDSAPTLGTITVPTLVVVGEEDALIPPSESRAIHAAIPGSRLEIIAGAGHVANVERPAAMNHLLAEFVPSVCAD